MQRGLGTDERDTAVDSSMDKGSDKLKQPLQNTVADASKTRDNNALQAAGRHAAGSAYDDKMPQTCCSTCQTVFEVSPELLASNDTRVRCGECLSIFDALSNLRKDNVSEEDNILLDEDGVSLDSHDFFTKPGDEVINDQQISESALDTLVAGSQLSESSDDASAMDLAHTEYDLFSGKAELPDVAYFDQTQEMDSLNFDEPDGDETFSDEIFAHDLTMGPNVAISPSVSGDATVDTLAMESNVDFVTDDVPSEPVVFNYQDAAPPAAAPPQPSPSPRSPDTSQPVDSATTLDTSSDRTSGRWVTRSVLVLLLLIMAVGLYGYRYRQEIIQNPDLRPFLSTTCSLIGCQLPPLVKLDQLKVLKRSVFSHPSLDNSLVIDLAFVNQATFSQGYPVLEIRLTNRNGGLVVQKNIEPANYLDTWQAGDLLSAGERLDLSLTVEDPGQTATSFELKFR